MQKSEQKPFYRSKKWWTAIIAALVPTANSIFSLGMEAEQLATIVLPLIAYVIGESWIDSTH